MSSAKPFAVAVDLGGTRIRAALVDRQGTILARADEATKAAEGPAVVTDQIAELVRTVSSGIGRSDIAGAGVSSPGPLDTSAGLALDIPTLAGFSNIPLRDMLAAKLALPVILENDGISAALGEWKHGAGKGYANLVYVTVSTGIGGGVIIDNKVLRGRHGMAGHVGHMSFMQGGDLCACGNRGCFEAYASGTAFSRRAAATRLGQHEQPVTPAAVFAAAASGDELAQKLVIEEGEFLGHGFASLLHLYSPDVLIMGGGIASQFAVLAPLIMRQLAATAMPAFRDTPILCAALGANSGLIGAASLVWDRP